MGARGVLQPGGFGGLGFGFGLRGAGLRLGFGRDGLALLDALRLLPDLLAHALGLRVPPLVARIAGQERDERDDDDGRHHGDDDPDNGCCYPRRLLRSVGPAQVIDEPANSADALAGCT